jgi:acetylornithine deacetylase
MIGEKAKNDIVSKVDALKDELIQLTSDLIRIPSVNPHYPGQVYEEVLGGETKVNEHIQPIMEGLGLETDLFEVEEGRGNLVGTLKGTGDGKSLIFNGHVDVVPSGPEEDWMKSKPWSGLVADGKVWGRGACDMKGGIASAIIALKAILEAGYKPKGDVILEEVVGEEMMNHEVGTTATVKRGYRADAAIVVEPSGTPYPFGLSPASPGLFYLRITVKGKATHACFRKDLVRAGGIGARAGVNSIDKAMIVYDALNKLEQEWGQTKIHPMFDHPIQFTLHPGAITGGPSGPFVVSDLSTIEYAIWHDPRDSEEKVKNEVEDQIHRFAKTDPWLKENPPKLEWVLWWPPYDLPADAPICKAVHAAYETLMNEPPKYSGFFAVDDASFLNLAGIPAITIGPGSGNIHGIHGADEFILISQLVDAAKIYALSIAEWCGI